MRLSSQEAETIKSAVTSIIGPGSRVWLFGSRVDDEARGGDIDLLIETDVVIPNRVEALCRLEGRLVMTLGDRKLDILLKDARTLDAPVHEVAQTKGVLL